MSLYEKMKTASENRDVDSYLDCIHDDFVFVRHQTGAEMSKDEWSPMLTAMMQSDKLEIKDQRCNAGLLFLICHSASLLSA